MVDSAPQWEAVLRRQKEKTQVDPNNRRSRHRSRSYVVLFQFRSKSGSWMGQVLDAQVAHLQAPFPRGPASLLSNLLTCSPFINRF